MNKDIQSYADKDIRRYVDFIGELEKIKNTLDKPISFNNSHFSIFKTFYEPERFLSYSENIDYDNFCYRVVIGPQRICFGIDFLPTNRVYIYIWDSGRIINVEEFLEICPEEYRKILLFNLNLIT